MPGWNRSPSSFAEAAVLSVVSSKMRSMDLTSELCVYETPPA